MLKLLWTITAISAAALLCVCDEDPPVAADTLAVADTLWVLHTNDHHGAIFPSGGLGGLPQRAAFAETRGDQYKKMLLLDAGDINTGSVLSNFFKAEPDILAYNFIGYDAVVLGNHEFDNPPEILAEQMAAAEFKFISANVRTPDGDLLTEPYIVKDVGGIRAAVIGITTTTAPRP